MFFLCLMKAVFVGTILSSLVIAVLSQEIGLDICACQPSTYEITIGALLTCADTTVAGAGIAETACITESRLPDTVNVTDYVPVTVSEIQVLELNQCLDYLDCDVVGQSIYTDGPYFNGDSIVYTSVVRTRPEIINNLSLPRGFQVITIGNNALNQPIVNSWTILYVNDCGIFPLLTIGQRIGWSIFTDLGNPPLQICPIGPPTDFPTISPTLFPTVSPTEERTADPTLSPTTEEPSSSPPTPDPSTPLLSEMPSQAPSPLCPPVITLSPSGAPTNNGRIKGSDPEKKTKKDYYYGSMMKITKKSSVSREKKAGNPVISETTGGPKSGAILDNEGGGTMGRGSSKMMKLFMSSGKRDKHSSDDEKRSSMSMQKIKKSSEDENESSSDDYGDRAVRELKVGHTREPTLAPTACPEPVNYRVKGGEGPNVQDQGMKSKRKMKDRSLRRTEIN